MPRGIIRHGKLGPERLRQVFAYDVAVGKFTRRNRPGAKVGTLTSKGYVSIMVDGELYVAHRLVWLYAYGCWPANQLDHINGIKTDNRLSNLREATNQQNSFGRGAHHDNRSGMKGVTKRNGCWQATIMKDRKSHYLGRFGCPTAARIAYISAARLHFGDFARI